MIKHLSRNVIINEIKLAISNSPHELTSRADGRAGILLEEILGISGGNHDVADAVGFELKTSINPNTPVTLFHKEAYPRGSAKAMVSRFGWDSTHGPESSYVKSFRATIYGSWKSKHDSDAVLTVRSNQEKVSIFCGEEEVVYWDSNDLVAVAAAKLRNMMLVFARDNRNGTLSYDAAVLLENFQPFKFIKALEDGHIAIEYDARTKPNSNSVRNHGTKFRIKERDLPLIYTKAERIFTN